MFATRVLTPSHRHPKAMTTERAIRGGGLGSRLLEALETRFELFGFELGEERDRLLATIVAALVAVVFLFAGLLSLNVVLVLAFWEQRLLVSAVMAVTYLGVGIGLSLTARNRVRNAPQPFTSTLDELRKDADAFRSGGGSS